MTVRTMPGQAALECSGLIGRIPVRNIWLLMLYASDLYRRVDGAARLKFEDNPDDIADLAAEILAAEVERRLKRNLSFGYRSREDILNRVRGRIDLLKTEEKRLLERGMVACRFEELTVDRIRNRYVRAALETVSTIVRDAALAHRCRALAAGMKKIGVGGGKPDRAEMSLDRVGRHEILDRKMVAAARLAFELALPTEESGDRRLSPPAREIEWVRKLFEKGVAGFYDVILSGCGWRVEAGKIIAWPVDRKSPGIDRILPSMRTDIILENEEKNFRIVIDTKFNSLVTRGWYRDETIRSGYLYQVYAYLRSQEKAGDPGSFSATGLLLHPAIGESIDESVVIQGHEIRFATVDLAADTREIRAQLLRFTDSGSIH